ncbi:MAG: hypothetical protein ACK4SZ_15680 [Allosphingosinicella sp.]|uniref:hypothetical protein n=1 Tax=Allosphingosinicella sp. TaxID=2823234 RepID=UPI00395771D8
MRSDIATAEAIARGARAASRKIACAAKGSRAHLKLPGGRLDAGTSAVDPFEAGVLILRFSREIPFPRQSRHHVE